MDKIRKEVHLTKDVVNAIQKKADSEKRSFKQYAEMMLEAIANDKVVILKK